MTADLETHRYVQPGWFTRNVFNRSVARLGRMGLSVAGSRTLAVRGRTSGAWRTTPVNPLPLEGQRYLVAPRGRTQWVQNIRAAGEGELRRGRATEAIRVEELTDADKPPVIRAYLAAWAWEVGQFFDGIDKTSSDAELLEVAPGFPVFRILAA